MAQTFEDYQDLSGVGFQGGSSEPTAPEDEFFHSVYIAGKTRKNHINVEEQAGKLQIRGVAYNLDNVNMIITHTKDILVKIKSEQGRDNVECFSYKDGSAPWFGTNQLPDGSKRQCPTTSADRATVEYCNPCRAQILVAGIYCNENGSPILTDQKKPIFIFIRAKGMKYSNVSEYLNDRYNEELSPIFEPVTEQTKAFEKQVVNNKRFVTKLSQGSASTRFNSTVNVFELSKGLEIPKEVVMKVLKMSKDTLAQFNDKFDWSKRRSGETTGYGSAPSGVEQFSDPEPQSGEQKQEPKTENKQAPVSGDTFNFDNIDF
jgi:hypothetical protein